MTKKNRRAAFTLVELIVVLAILAVLLIVIVPRVTGYVSEARETAAQNNASAILRAAELYVVDQEGDGKDPAGTYTNGGGEGATLDGYIDNLDEKDNYTLTIVYNDDSSQYDISGSYTSGDITVTIPEMTVAHNDASE